MAIFRQLAAIVLLVAGSAVYGHPSGPAGGMRAIRDAVAREPSAGVLATSKS